ncbi:hypothetical protein SCHPADRAFT_1001478 [Schizopora paradoxa]|uniref:MYND-type domain-containing protein n=1 Tax=Schizopora paradoxa TaxID=27342 RepID=A0A0H2RDR6_9AGAM|nr:hypothetical protein SCHPADRAFT_1001478 [Schizopora paradoxa]
MPARSRSVKPTISSSEATKLIRAARVDLKSLARLIDGLKGGSVALATSDNLRTDCFEVFHHHLRKPVEDAKGDEIAFVKPIFFSLFGLTRLGSRYFNSDAIHRQRFKLCWPRIMAWLDAIVEGGFFHKDEGLFFSSCQFLFEIAWIVRREYFDEDDVFKLTTRLWIGHKGVDSTDYYTEQPLIACIQRKVANNDTVGAVELIQSYDICAENLIDTILARLMQATYDFPTIKISKISLLINMLAHLIALSGKIAVEVASRRVGRVLIRIMTKIVNVPSVSEDFMLAVRATLRIFHSFLYGETSDYTLCLMEDGILGLLLKAASLGFDNDIGDQNSTTARVANGISECMVLRELIRALSYRSMVIAARRGRRKLYQKRVVVEELLETTPNEFRDAWETFETVLLEQAIVLSLFGVEFSKDSGACSNSSCSLWKSRKRLQKCGGCSVALYCSTSCQRGDWRYHRNVCKKMDKKSLQDISSRIYRFQRRVATLQCVRFEHHITSISLRKNIPMHDVAIRFNYGCFPFELDVFDCHELLDETKHPPGHVLVAEEVLRRSDTDREKCMVLIVSLVEKEIPYIIYPNRTWAKEVSELPEDLNDEETFYISEDGEILSSDHFDALRACKQLARKHASEGGLCVWDSQVINKAVHDVMRTSWDGEPTTSNSD